MDAVAGTENHAAGDALVRLCDVEAALGHFGLRRFSKAAVTRRPAAKQPRVGRIAGDLPETVTRRAIPVAGNERNLSPLAGQRPEGGRLSLFERFSRYSNDNAERATYEYVSLFRRHGIDPAQGALAFVNNRAFVTSNIIGATTLAQLRSNIDSLQVTLPPEVLDGIEAIHQRYPNPAP